MHHNNNCLYELIFIFKFFFKFPHYLQVFLIEQLEQQKDHCLMVKIYSFHLLDYNMPFNLFNILMVYLILII